MIFWESNKDSFRLYNFRVPFIVIAYICSSNQIIMKQYSFTLFLLLFTSVVFSQLNMSFVGRVDYAQLHGTMLNGVWGYVDETGIEYAVVGTRKGVVYCVFRGTQPIL